MDKYSPKKYSEQFYLTDTPETLKFGQGHRNWKEIESSMKFISSCTVEKVLGEIASKKTSYIKDLAIDEC